MEIKFLFTIFLEIYISYGTKGLNVIENNSFKTTNSQILSFLLLISFIMYKSESFNEICIKL